jgi:hypothetical protein
MKRTVVLARGDFRMLVDGDGVVRALQSLSEGRLLFGRSQLYFSKVQAGIVVGAQRPDWSVRLTPTSAHLSGRIFDVLEVAQTFEFPSSSCVGYLRRLRVRNSGGQPVRLRVTCLFDPTAAHFREPSSPWGSLGVNAFNRESHVAMDEISEPHPARVIGCCPVPSRFFMTTDRAKVTELLQGDDLPESIAGMSGQVLILSFHELEVTPSESREFVFASLYSSKRLEEVLSEFGRLQSEGYPSYKKEAPLVCSSPRVSETFGWACSSMEGAQYGEDLLDSLEVLRGLEYIDPAAAEAVVGKSRVAVLKDGFLRHSEDRARPGPLETSLFLAAVSRHLVLTNDRRAARQAYAFLRRAANALVFLQRGGSMQLDQAVPQGWRRFVRSGYPCGEVPEVSLATADALSCFARVSHLLGKGEDAARFREKSELIADGVSKVLVDDRGLLGLSVDSSGKMRSEDTIDMAVACYRNPVLRKSASSAIHRLLEKDFETEYGPRTVPTSNRMYFHSAYGHGQLGGFWTRGALAFACLTYAIGLSGIGSLSLEKVSRLVTEDTPSLGGVLGEFPYWVDVEGREARGEKSDSVSGSRFVQAVVEGELGLEVSGNTPSFNPPGLSTIKWLLARDLWAGERITLFVGRSGESVYSFGNCQRAGLEGGQKFAKCEQVDVSPSGVHAMSFFGPGQVVCVGNSSPTPIKAHVGLAPRASGLSKQLFAPLEEFEPSNSTWNKVGSLRVSPMMTFDAPIGPSDWKAYRLSND